MCVKNVYFYSAQVTAPQMSKKEVEDLLKKGAYGAIMEEDDAASKFCEEDIDQILDRRAKTVTLESGEKGSTFSKVNWLIIYECFRAIITL